MKDTYWNASSATFGADASRRHVSVQNAPFPLACWTAGTALPCPYAPLRRGELGALCKDRTEMKLGRSTLGCDCTYSAGMESTRDKRACGHSILRPTSYQARKPATLCKARRNHCIHGFAWV
jgi:hypothetical protein